MQVEGIINKLEKNIDKKKEEYNLRKGQRDQLVDEKKERQKRIKKLKEEIEVFEETRILLQETAEYAREQAKQQIENLVTKALQYVFGSEFSFKIEIEEKRGRPSAEFYVVSDYQDQKLKNNPQTARGGGIVDVVSLALRIAILESYRPKVAGPLVLDEPAKHVSEEYISNVAQFLKHINQHFSRQVIIVTHKSYLSEIGDKAFQVKLREGISEVTTDF
ncbi:ATP-binding protein [Sporohalobacter salinus]|uniref:ATP-binding protein n=1 Tax=Sporohalobacter salinus TaxID=1494606 RepID=UPI0019610010|nr:ATP-binding protein [Sporohalobacter salinus]MBM7623270.1 DNA repair exonuclease SbcCD ATPase subunit [Sporohalobacter salinus]